MWQCSEICLHKVNKCFAGDGEIRNGELTCERGVCDCDCVRVCVYMYKCTVTYCVQRR